MARPKIELDAAQIESLASFGLTNREIGEFLGASEATIGRRFASETRKGRAALHKSLRRKQTEVALSGNVTMLIWLGKNMLGQTDRQQVEVIDWRDEAKRDGYDPDKLFWDMVNAARETERARLDGAGGGGSVGGSAATGSDEAG